MTTAPEHIFALIVGVNEYQSPKIKNLSGAENDADAMALFLDSLKVPKDNICLLKNQQATRQNILDTFHGHLFNNPAINNGDAIIFFFAGHGSQVDAPKGWETGEGAGKIETICPHDEWEPDANGKETPGIPDRTVNALLRKLSGEKGNNITVIFDSCHSGGAARIRTASGEILHPRVVQKSCPITDPDLDRHIWDKTDPGRPIMDIPKGFVHSFMASHVFLAACMQDQVAYETTTEKGACGAFTNALIPTLYTVPLDRITYEDLTKSLPKLSNQVPQCEGKHKDRILFNARVLPSESLQVSFELKKKDERVYEVNAGLIAGVNIGTEFFVRAFDYSIPSGQPLGLLVAEKVESHSAILIRRKDDAPFDVPEGARAFISSWKNDASILKVFAERDDDIKLLEKPQVDATKDEQLSRTFFSRVPTKNEADIVLRYEEKSEELVVERLDAVIGKTAKALIRYTLPKDKVANIPFMLDHMAAFRYHLLRHHGDIQMFQDADHAFHSNLQEVKMNMYRLGEPAGGFRAPDKTKNFFVNSQANLKAPALGQEEARYGFEILNYSNRDLYVYLFYFDPSDYSVQYWYFPFSSQSSPTLKAMQGDEPGRVTVGYGAGGGDPIMFVLSPEEKKDTGFLKLFLSDQYVDMKHIVQRKIADVSGKREGIRKADDLKIWFSLLAGVTVVA